MRQLRIKEVQADRKSERWGEDADGESAVASKDASRKCSNADIEKTRCQRLGLRNERLDFAFNRALDGDPAINEGANRGACVGSKMRKALSCGANLSFELSLNGDELDFGVRFGVDGELLSVERVNGDMR